MTGRLTSPISVLLVDDSPHHNERIGTLLALEPDFIFVGAELTGWDGVAAAQRLQPDVVLMDINLPDIDGLKATQEICQTVPGCAVIMLSIQDERSYMNKATLVGARSYLTKPVSPDELYTTIRKVYWLMLQERQQDTSSEKSGSMGKVIVVYSPQGGVGCTTIAMNLAYGLMQTQSRVLLMDADIQFGDVCYALNMKPTHTLADLWGTGGDIDQSSLEQIILEHGCGMNILPCAHRLEYALTLQANGELVSTIMTQVTTLYDYVVIDTHSYLDDFLLALLEVADRIILVSTPVLESVKNLGRLLDYLTAAGYPREKFQLVINRIEEDLQYQQMTLSQQRIERHLGQPVSAKFPIDAPVLREAIKHGIPLLTLDPQYKKALTRKLSEFAGQVHHDLQLQAAD